MSLWKIPRFGTLRLLPEVLFTLSLYPLILSLFAVSRLLLLYGNEKLAVGVPADVLAESFLVGLRFDLAVASYLLLPFFFLLLLFRRKRSPILFLFYAAMGGVIFGGIAEVEFYREMESRFNKLVFEYLSHPKIVGGMIWDGYPVLRYLIIWGVLFAFFFFVASRLQRRFLPSSTSSAGFLKSLPGGFFLVILMVFAARGGVTGEPLRWGDAFFSENPFANHLALNGMYTLGRSAWDTIYGKKSVWDHAMPEEDAVKLTRHMLLTPGEEEIPFESAPILRRSVDASPLLHPPKGGAMNVVVILMESFSARQVGALGAQEGVTPFFDDLSRRGILFDRALSNGTHTHQGVFASLASFPNLPGYEYLMKTMEANQDFSGLPTFLKEEGYETLFLYNGLLSWDNKEGFFRQHGIDRFVGREDYVDPIFVDPVWGVSDFDVFMRANEEFRAASEKGPFFGAILTLSNHSPFNLPDPLPFEKIRTGDETEGRLNAMRYADWALGEFFRKAQGEEYFANTLFVLCADHGFGQPTIISEMFLERHHVPLLFYSPALASDAPGRRHTVASQVDITPSVLGLLGLDIPHQSWGRNLFAPGLKDDGFAVFKASGGEDKIALIEGDRLLVKAPKKEARLYAIDLGFPPSSRLLPEGVEDERRSVMEMKLQAYVETGLRSLRSRELGVPGEAELPPDSQYSFSKKASASK